MQVRGIIAKSILSIPLTETGSRKKKKAIGFDERRNSELPIVTEEEFLLAYPYRYKEE